MRLHTREAVVTALAQGANTDAVSAEDLLFDAASHMLDDAIRHLPVADENGTVVGMVSIRDLVGPLLLDALGG